MSIKLIKNLSAEMDIRIWVLPYKGVIDATVIPAYCLNCSKQLSGLFHHQGSRYGQVGTIECDHCQETIYCTDEDNIQKLIFLSLDTYFNRWIYTDDNFDMKLMEIDFTKLYKVNKGIMNEIDCRLAAIGKETFLHEMERIELNELVDIISDKLNVTDLPCEKIIVDDRFHRLPQKVNRWLNLLKVLRIN